MRISHRFVNLIKFFLYCWKDCWLGDLGSSPWPCQPSPSDLILSLGLSLSFVNEDVGGSPY